MRAPRQRREGIASLPVAIFFVALVATSSAAAGVIASGQSSLSAKQLSAEAVSAAKQAELNGLSVSTSGGGVIQLTNSGANTAIIDFVLLQAQGGKVAVDPAHWLVSPTGHTTSENLMPTLQSTFGQDVPASVTLTLVTGLGNYLTSQLQTSPQQQQQSNPQPQGSQGGGNGPRATHTAQVTTSSTTAVTTHTTTVSTHTTTTSHTTSGCAAGFVMTAAGCGARGGCPTQDQMVCGHPISTQVPPKTNGPPRCEGWCNGPPKVHTPPPQIGCSHCPRPVTSTSRSMIDGIIPRPVNRPAPVSRPPPVHQPPVQRPPPVYHPPRSLLRRLR